ncbi:uncharacterized protein RJT20DRAFT_127163 [Scheffersomyces xylosifermentans]|uniref:uncharacterized protein n=1 Tax=Scheffersomyces xylosifermentans TaxID=1304137 RepID=UPI00315C5D57
MSNIPPQTPPRASRSGHNGGGRSPANLTTPATPIQDVGGFLTPSTHSKQKNAFLAVPPPSSSLFKTPSSIQKKKQSIHNVGKSVSLLPLTPDFTPQRSPNRSARKRKVASNELFKQDNSEIENTNNRLSFGLLLPAPSTVGSGRKSNTSLASSAKISKPKSLNFESLSRLNSNLQFEEEEVDEDIDEEQENALVSASRVPSTPSKQLINKGLVNEWYGKSYNNFSSDEDLSDAEMDEILSKPQHKMENPFVDNGKESNQTKPLAFESTTDVANPFAESSNSNGKNVNYATHMELVNHRTGEKRVLKLTSHQSKIKPKKLDFSSV